MMKQPRQGTPTYARRTVLSVSFVLASSLVLQGCSSGNSEADSGDIELTVLNQSRGQAEALTALAAKYSEETGIKVSVDTPGPADFMSKLQSKAQSNSMPDLFSSVGNSEMAPFYKAGWAFNLESEMNGDWSKNFQPDLLKVTKFNEGNPDGVKAGIYSAHWEISVYGLLVNPDKGTINPSVAPATMADLTKKLAEGGEKGQGKFSISASMVPNLIQYYASNYMSDEEIDATFLGKASWKTEAWRKTFKLLEDLAKAGAIASNTIPGGSGDNAAVEKSFFNTRDIGAIFDGSFSIAVARSSAPDFTNYRSLPLPKAADATHEPRARFDTGKGMSVNAKGKHTKESLAFLKWLTAAEQQTYFAKKMGILPSNPEVLKSDTISAQAEGFRDLLPTLQVVPSSLSTDVKNVIQRGSQNLVLGETTPDKLLEDIQVAQDKSK
ncbi:ABC transporter substrate-binding protein [Arthrobacter sp. B1I2]|uniref:ABC transporter substrate-binding protein n=1 Tax=Arthrobacter sp. B1I2 TaxID=3042263 RepID=UPI00277D621A|nr:ABC transporter substrate-binding protein [Arthrobacter sp. B1I2]MDQ0733338.1 raffinose/stachyose/melibiose transport system substrate-binding protein [Arthrobacter sp. B1I2]